VKDKMGASLPLKSFLKFLFQRKKSLEEVVLFLKFILGEISGKWMGGWCVRVI
jgi:hypothetical protein